jgi:hypothetical protein
LHPDNAWFVSSSLVYASNVQADGPSGYFTGIGSNGITNGAAWYSITGGRQDWMNCTRNGREVTIECSNTKMPSAGAMPSYWNYNYEAILSYTEQALYGIHGTVKDAYGNPLQATISVIGHDNTYSMVETDPNHGDFYRYLQPGNYNLLISTAGYADKTVNVSVSANAKTPVTIVFGELPTVINLNTGWNLISLNRIPSSQSVIDVFSGISGLLQIKNETLSYAPGLDEHFNTLKNLVLGEGYWVNMSAPGTLHVEGSLAASTPISLRQGWNLVGYLPAAAQATATALASISAYLQEVNHLGNSYVPGGSSSLNSLEPGKAYWIKVSQDCTLIYP